MAERDPAWIWIAVPIGLALLAGVGALLGKLLRRAGLGAHEISTRAGAAALNLQTIFEPSKRNVVEAKKERKLDQGQGGPN